MGEAVEFMLDGILCQVCGVFIDGESPGYPRTCEGCEEEERKRRRKNGKKNKN